MSIKDQFNEDEWFLLSSTPAMIAASVSAADPSGMLGAVQEMSASMKASVAGMQAHPDSALIQGLLDKAQNWDEAKERMQDYRERSKVRIEAVGSRDAAGLQQAALEDAGKAMALIEERLDAAEASAYRDWTLSIARSVAEAAREGSLLNFGGERVSEREQAWLAKLAEVLGGDTTVLSA